MSKKKTCETTEYSWLSNKRAASLIDFEKFAPPARLIFPLLVYWNLIFCPPCSFIPSCLFLFFLHKYSFSLLICLLFTKTVPIKYLVTFPLHSRRKLELIFIWRLKHDRFPPCSFIEANFFAPSARLFHPARLRILENLPPCSPIPSCSFIR